MAAEAPDPYKFLQITINPDGTFTSSNTYGTTSANIDDSTTVLTKDISINQSKQTWARIFLPKQALDDATQKLPVFVYFHGGGFILYGPDESMGHVFCSNMASQLGVIIVSASYRLAPQHRLPAAYEDAMEALSWIKTTSENWLQSYANFSNIFFMGGSAGGNIAYQLGLRAAEQADNLLPLKIKGLILHQPFFGGVERTESELRSINDPAFPPSVSDLMWELSLPVGVDRDHEYSNPTVGVHGSTALEKIKVLGWRVFVAGCNGDQLIDRQIELVKVMQKKGIQVVSRVVEGGCHGLEVFDPPKAKPLAKVTFGLNALIGRKKSNIAKGLWVGDWKSQNAKKFMNYSISKRYKINSYEFGNELCGSGIGTKVEAKQYEKNVIALKNLVKELNPNPKTQSKILGPSGFYDKKWFNTFLKVSGYRIVDTITHHIYNLGSDATDDPNLITKIQDPFYLNQVAKIHKNVSKVVKKFGPLSGAWISGIGGALDNGLRDVSPSFAGGFWSLNQLGMASTFNHKYIFICLTCCFSTGALLWHWFMGSNVLFVIQKADPNLRVYAHCAKKKPGISLLFINLSKDRMSNVTFLNDQKTMRHNLKSRGVVRPNFEFRGYQNKEAYHLTPLDGDIQSDIMLLNDVPLNPTDSLNILAMDPKLVDTSSPISAPHSIVFVTIKDFSAPA
ncbi:hypothetical protein PTKIN_Ptkin17bG0009900 [Pterospermum kingtungense]